jgi:hypothetical protein
VIHVGCLDHVPLIRQRIENNTWLHKRLTEASQTCLGIDINEEGAVLVRTLGFDNVVICNLIDDDPLPEVVGAKWDYMVLGEMLEHIDNPVLFLENIAAKYGNCVDRFLLTVPNAIHLDRRKCHFFGTDCFGFHANRNAAQTTLRLSFRPLGTLDLAFYGHIAVYRNSVPLPFYRDSAGITYLTSHSRTGHRDLRSCHHGLGN